jgi:hypothetical protein
MLPWNQPSPRNGATSDAQAAIRWVTEVLGFLVSLVIDGDEGGVAHAELLLEDRGDLPRRGSMAAAPPSPS